MPRNPSVFREGGEGMTRAGVIGIFGVDQLFAQKGIRRYLVEMAEQDTLFGEFFRFAPVMLHGRALVPRLDLKVCVSRREAQASVTQAKRQAHADLRCALYKARRQGNCTGVVVGSRLREGAFQSTWYDRDGFKHMLRVAGICRERFALSVRQQGKGFVFSIHPREEATTSVVTCLNNVIGCAYIGQQMRELGKIARLLRGEAPARALNG